ncbi:hypothetical protein MRB53_006613 [Persea americana]|uniref:Uncharacterized protein n=1 Tax=Persea americana TaxID=3435 RepID=A0ACC2MGS4_PERAE|nr:hypothetical protein MRB53_006613 [Persea americana]
MISTWSLVGLQRASTGGAGAIPSEPRGYTRVVEQVAAGHALGALARLKRLRADRADSGRENRRKRRRRRAGDGRIRHRQRLVEVEAEVVRTGLRLLRHFFSGERGR